MKKVMDKPSKADWIGFLHKLPFYGGLHCLVQVVRHLLWKMHGCPMPPPHKVKQQVLRRLAADHDLRILVETGTNLGDMVYAMRKSFSAIHSIELSEELYEQALRRFRKWGHVALVHGDSGVVLHGLVRKLEAPALFWLDGHYSGGTTALGDDVTPVLKELDAVLGMSHPHVVAIDDARLFGTDVGYPTMDELVGFVRSKNENLQVHIDNDIVTIHSSSGGALCERADLTDQDRRVPTAGAV